jgi:hypothetical protein
VLRLIEEGALSERVLAALPRLLHEVEALVDLALGVPVRAVEAPRRLAGDDRLARGAGERDLARVLLFDRTGAVPSDVAGARVQDRRPERQGESSSV